MSISTKRWLKWSGAVFALQLCGARSFAPLRERCSGFEALKVNGGARAGLKKGNAKRRSEQEDSSGISRGQRKKKAACLSRRLSTVFVNFYFVGWTLI
jgi:hypothetical protein